MVYGSLEKNKNMKRIVCILLLGFIASVSKAQSAATTYVERYKDAAIAKMNEHGIPASVILAIAMHESASGTSKIARHLNNHFGIKGKNRVASIRSAYKSYDTVADSYEDFIAVLKKHPSFAKLFGRYSSSDYKNWVKGIQRGGYAHSKTWGAQVLGFIKKYELYQYDQQPTQFFEDLRPDSVAIPGAPAAKESLYQVKRGDTLSGIAKKLNVRVDDLMRKNKLKNSRIQPGQKLQY